MCGNASGKFYPFPHGAGPFSCKREWRLCDSRSELDRPSRKDQKERPVRDGGAVPYFFKGVKFYLCRQLGPQEMLDKVHDTFLIVVQAVQRGELREPERMMGFVHTVARRQVAAHIDQTVKSRNHYVGLDSSEGVKDLNRDPEQTAIDQQREAVATQILRSMSQRDCDVLTRFYLMEQSQEQICKDMNLSDTQFRLLKPRAKARFGEFGKRCLRARSNVS